MDRATPNLPSADLDRTQAFYAALGFSVGCRDDGWMILERGAIVLEFFPLTVDPKTTFGSACLRVDDHDGLRAVFEAAGALSEFLPGDARHAADPGGQRPSNVRSGRPRRQPASVHRQSVRGGRNWTFRTSVMSRFR